MHDIALPINLMSLNNIYYLLSITGTIFQHLKRLRNSSYPTDRAIALVDAISRDLLSQMLKALGTQKLMVVDYREFDTIYRSSYAVFIAWEEEFEKFTSLLRDQAKKKRDEGLKFHFKFNLSHKKLELRLEHMRE